MLIQGDASSFQLTVNSNNNHTLIQT
jgi:hypothetical protein